MIGTVEEFDADRGWGTVLATGGERFPFHCTAISDGSRSIAVGATVTFDLRPGLRGRWEATRLQPG